MNDEKPKEEVKSYSDLVFSENVASNSISKTQIKGNEQVRYYPKKNKYIKVSKHIEGEVFECILLPEDEIPETFKVCEKDLVNKITLNLIGIKSGDW